jgi:hypothetical protein
VADVEEDLVLRRIEDRVESQRKLDYPQIGAQMAPGLGEGLDQEFADLFREAGHLLVTQAFYVSGRMDGLQQGSHVCPSSGEKAGHLVNAPCGEKPCDGAVPSGCADLQYTAREIAIRLIRLDGRARERFEAGLAQVTEASIPSRQPGVVGWAHRAFNNLQGANERGWVAEIAYFFDGNGGFGCEFKCECGVGADAGAGDTTRDAEPID